MTRTARLLLLGFAVLTACSGEGTAAPAVMATSVQPATSGGGIAASSGGDGGCGATPVMSSPKPSWATAAPDTRWVGDGTDSIAGFLFADPLRAGHPEHPANKILWVVNGPRNGAPLEVELHPVGTVSPVVTDSYPADSSPGEIYPSIIDVPTAGCWHATLRWNGHTAGLDLRFV